MKFDSAITGVTSVCRSMTSLDQPEPHGVLQSPYNVPRLALAVDRNILNKALCLFFDAAIREAFELTIKTVYHR
jgi:hypothetical protein